MKGRKKDLSEWEQRMTSKVNSPSAHDESVKSDVSGNSCPMF